MTPVLKLIGAYGSIDYLIGEGGARPCALTGWPCSPMWLFHESRCGQCTPCRVGCEKAVKLMQAERWDTGLLEDLCEVMADASICGLGQAAPNPIRLTLKHFPDEV